MGICCHTPFLSIDPLSRCAPICRVLFSVPYHARSYLGVMLGRWWIPQTPTPPGKQWPEAEGSAKASSASVLDLHWSGLQEDWPGLQEEQFFWEVLQLRAIWTVFALSTAHWERQEAGQRWVNSSCLSANPKSSLSISEPNYGNSNISINVMGYRIRS